MNDASLESQVEVEAAGVRSGSSLCLKCGLCCNGTVFSHVPISVEEIIPMRELGLDVQFKDDKPFFPLPCIHFRESACQVYAHRPMTCQNYRCKLLKSYLAQEIELDAAQMIVLNIKQAVQRANQHLPVDREERQRLLQEVDQVIQQDGDSVELMHKKKTYGPLLLALATVRALLKRHILK